MLYMYIQYWAGHTRQYLLQSYTVLRVKTKQMSPVTLPLNSVSTAQNFKWQNGKAFQGRTIYVQYALASRGGNSLIWFPSESLVFCPIMSDLLIFGERPELFAHNHSFPLSDLSESLMVANFWWAKWAIRSNCSFDLREMSDSLTLLTKKEEMS